MEMVTVAHFRRYLPLRGEFEFALPRIVAGQQLWVRCSNMDERIDLRPRSRKDGDGNVLAHIKLYPRVIGMCFAPSFLPFERYRPASH